MTSLAARLNLALGLSLAALIAAAWWLGHAALHRSAEAYVISHLEHASEALVSALSANPAAPAPELQAVLAPVYRQPFSGHYFEVLGLDGARYSSRSLWDQRLPLSVLPVGQTTEQHLSGPLGQRLLVRSSGYRIGSHRFTIAVAEDLDPLLGALHPFERLFAVLAVIGFLLMLLLQHLTVRWTFRQLDPVYRDIEALERGTAEAITEAVPVEILPLVRKFNALLDVYGQRLARSRNAAGNLAHALKAPLNLLVQHIERPDPPSSLAQQQRCLEQVDRVKALVERELKRSRIAGGLRPGLMFDTSADLPPLIQVLERMYSDKGLSVACQDRLSASLMIDREDMLELIGNLLDNACKWANSRVLCRLDSGASGLCFEVEDDGPGCSDSELAAIGARGVRVDERVEGHGLGLSIVREILALYQGRLRLDRSPSLGGLRASIELPIPVSAAR